MFFTYPLKNKIYFVYIYEKSLDNLKVSMTSGDDKKDKVLVDVAE
ncbi:hypothetical protein [Clostridium lundense]|nr:hypothetical protein [Clostridium lundense]